MIVMTIAQVGCVLAKYTHMLRPRTTAAKMVLLICVQTMKPGVSVSRTNLKISAIVANSARTLRPMLTDSHLQATVSSYRRHDGKP
jgi:hypothetical protein